MYQALYRKYRPTVFDDVVGQEHITTTLKNEVAAGKTSHAYLFTGSRGTGKTTCSKILAKAVNCLDPRDGNPCGECEICRGIDGGSILDVVEIDAASNNGVDNIRQLREEAYFLPAQCKKRVYIIDETHMLSTGAFNALLKIMEEPPAHVLFILATTEVHKIPATILSRCQRFDFRRIPPDIIAGRLQFIAQSEGFTLDGDAALLIARLADGGVRDAISLLDLCSSHGREITAELAAEAAGLAGHGYLFRLTDALAKQDTGEALAIIDELYRQSVDLERLCEEMISHFRDLMIFKSAAKPDELIVLLPEEREQLQKQQADFKMSAILHGLTVLQETLGRMSRSPNRRTELELALIRLCNPQLDNSPDALLRRIERLEEGRPPVNGSTKESTSDIHPGASSKKAAPRADLTQAPPHTEPESAPAAIPQSSPEPFAEWGEVLARLAKTNPALTGTLKGSCAYLQGDICLIDCQDQLFFTLIRQSDVSKTTLREALFAQTGKRYRLGPYKREMAAEAAEQKKDPLDDLTQLVRDSGASFEIR
ncbi:DNA polymerase III subunit gamma/tau [Ligaoa zhengdingensis]|uniref:DNA polymerase III subunit gamma/tau n=2 Tax=Ligaoa zhengdingensis TaxID=2763658 RepID=UPI0031BA4D52